MAGTNPGSRTGSRSLAPATRWRLQDQVPAHKYGTRPQPRTRTGQGRPTTPDQDGEHQTQGQDRERQTKTRLGSDTKTIGVDYLAINCIQLGSPDGKDTRRRGAGFRGNRLGSSGFRRYQDKNEEAGREQDRLQHLQDGIETGFSSTRPATASTGGIKNGSGCYQDDETEKAGRDQERLQLLQDGIGSRGRYGFDRLQLLQGGNKNGSGCYQDGISRTETGTATARTEARPAATGVSLYRTEPGTESFYRTEPETESRPALTGISCTGRSADQLRPGREQDQEAGRDQDRLRLLQDGIKTGFSFYKTGGSFYRTESRTALADTRT